MPWAVPAVAIAGLLGRYASMGPTLLICLLFAGCAALPSSGRNFREITGGVTEGK